jgi:hypothetical protein
MSVRLSPMTTLISVVHDFMDSAGIGMVMTAP